MPQDTIEHLLNEVLELLDADKMQYYFSTIYIYLFWEGGVVGNCKLKWR
jgi:hypothetical protein